MSFAVFKANLQAQISRFPQTLNTDEECITYAFQCMTGSSAQYIAMFYNDELQDNERILVNYPVFLKTTERLFGDQDTPDEFEHKLLVVPTVIRPAAPAIISLINIKVCACSIT